MNPSPSSPTNSAPDSPHAVWSRIAAWAFAVSGMAASSATPIPVSETSRTSRVDFEREILPLFQRNCLACHNQTRAKADLVLETPAFIAQGGASGPAVMPGKGEESLLFRSAAHRINDLVMPPVGNKSNAANLTPDELGLLRLWIDQGATGEVQRGRSLTWQPIPDSWNVSYAVAIDRHAQLIACARANRVQLYDARTGRPAGRLTDPDLQGAAQRDVVSALAFSPTDDLVAAAGFREVQLWKRGLAPVREILRAAPGGSWVAAAVSPDRSLLALVTASGDLQLRKTDSGEPLTSWPSLTTTPAQLAFSPDGQRLAVAGASGSLHILPTAGGPPSQDQSLPSAPSALAWFDAGQALATTFHDARTIQTWRLPEHPDARQLVPGPNLATHDSPITALITDADGHLVSASTDGTVYRWPTDPASPPAKVACDNPVAGLDAAGPQSRILVRFASGGSAWIEFEGTPRLLRTLRGNPRLESDAAASELQLDLARLDLSVAEKAIQDSESESKKATEALTKAREKRDAQAKTLEDHRQSLAKHQEEEKAATRERDQLAADLQNALDESAATEKAVADARQRAHESADRALAARLAADQAQRLKADLERIVQSLAGGAEDPSVAKSREAAEAAAADAAAKTRVTSEARTLADNAIEELAAKAFAAGQKKAFAERAQAELPPRKKQAEERMAAAKKAIGEVQPRIEKARITLEGGEKDVELADQAVSRAAQAIASAKEAAETARTRIAQHELGLKQRQEARDAGATKTHLHTHATLSGDTVVSLDAEGSLIVWDTTSGAATPVPARIPSHPTALIALDDATVLLVSPEALQRVDLTPQWTRIQTLGGTEPPGTVPSALADRVNALAFSPDGTLLATGGGEPSRSGELKLWRVADGTLVRDLGAVHSDAILSVAFSPRGERIATGGADRFARISDVATGALLRSLEGHTHHVMSVAWLAHGGTLATGGAEGTLKIWNAHTGERLKNVDGFGKEITGLRPVGLTPQFVAVAGSGQGRLLRDNGDKVRDLPSAPSYFEALATSPDGKWAAVAADDGILRIWEIEAAKERFALPPK